MSENKLCRYCLIGLTETDASSNFCCEEHRVNWNWVKMVNVFQKDRTNNME